MFDIDEYKAQVIKSRGLNLVNEKRVIELPTTEIEMTDLERVIYAPNPETGFPDSDLALQMDESIRPEIRNALIARNAKIENLALSHDNDDVVLDTIRRGDESDLSYSERMQQYVDDFRNALKKDSD